MILFILAVVQICGFVSGDEGFYNIAHMVNTPGTVEWAIGQGANGVEIDLAFDTGTGNALFFRHSAEGEACDCTCLCPAPFWALCGVLYPNSVCAKLLYDVSNISPCQAKSSYSTLLSTIATKSSIALVIIDSKIEKASMTDDVMRNAGRSVITALTSHLFGLGYGGKVIVGSPKLDTLPYLQSAVNAIKGSPYESRVYFTVDLEKDNIVNTLTTLHTLPTMNIVYGTGISACSPQQMKTSTMELAAANKAKGVIGLAYLWTVDSKSTILDNLPYVQGVLSNYPGQVNDILIEKGIKKATQSSTIPPATNRNVVTSTASMTCDCNYHSGGCTISRAAPQGMACHCEYKGGWTCGGSIAQCSDPNSYYCKNPDTSVNSCLLGDGDCEGYKTATCDCNYHPGGCSISQVPPKNTACRCVYKGFWTCGGEITRCRDENSQYCKNPDSSINTCIQGGGDCEGYKTATCDCDYHPGGCSISTAAPKNTACKCVYKGAWTCGGEIVRCNDFNSQYCLNPDTSIQACFEGRGDCEGYKTATCDCNYHRGGCTISTAPPRNTACRCVYKGWWTCGGSITRCNDFNSYYCKYPDTSRNTCWVGGGDCGGY